MSRSIHLRSALIGGLVAGLVMTALPAIAAKVGDPTELGVTNKVNRQTALIRTKAGTALAVTAKAGGSPLKLVSKDGSPPMKINSSAKVIRLNADRLDGMDSTAFLGATAKATNADLLDDMDSTAFLGATAKAADADKLDGMDSTAFLGASAKAADSNLLDGMDSNAFLGTTATAVDSDKLDGLHASAFTDRLTELETDLATSTQKPQGDDLEFVGLWGTFGAWQFCPAGSFVGGVSVQIEPDQGLSDDTAMNGIKLACFTPGD